MLAWLTHGSESNCLIWSTMSLLCGTYVMHQWIHPMFLSLQSPYQCNLLVAGWDENVGPSLYWMDYLATLSKVNTGGTGYGRWCKRTHA